MQFLMDLCTWLGTLLFSMQACLSCLIFNPLSQLWTSLLFSHLPGYGQPEIFPAVQFQVGHSYICTHGHSSKGNQINKPSTVMTRGAPAGSVPCEEQCLSQDFQWVPRGRCHPGRQTNTCLSAMGGCFLKVEQNSEGKISWLLYCASFLSFQLLALYHSSPNFSAIIDGKSSLVLRLEGVKTFTLNTLPPSLFYDDDKNLHSSDP